MWESMLNLFLVGYQCRYFDQICKVGHDKTYLLNVVDHRVAFNIKYLQFQELIDSNSNATI